MRVVNLFVAASFDVNAADHDRTTALAQAASGADMPMVTALLHAGARAGAPVDRVDTALSWAAYARQPTALRALRALLDAEPGTAAVKHAFIAAVRKGYVAGMELLGPRGVDLAADGVEALAQTALLEREDNDPDPDHVAAAAKLLEWACQWLAPTSRASRC